LGSFNQQAIVAFVLFQNGLVFVGEGVMIGCGSFMQVSITTVIASAGCMWALSTFPQVYGLSGVWMAFGVFNTLRLAGVLWYQFRSGPFASCNLDVECR